MADAWTFDLVNQSKTVDFKPYTAADGAVCLDIFDANCPTYFARNERDDYIDFLDSDTGRYEVCVVDNRIVGAFGLYGKGLTTRTLRWILIDPGSHGLGIGSAIMDRVVCLGNASELKYLTIAASHLSEPFFARIGAVTKATTKNGWGPGMNRVDMELHL